MAAKDRFYCSKNTFFRIATISFKLFLTPRKLKEDWGQTKDTQLFLINISCSMADALLIRHPRITTKEELKTVL